MTPSTSTGGNCALGRRGRHGGLRRSLIVRAPSTGAHQMHTSRTCAASMPAEEGIREAMEFSPGWPTVDPDRDRKPRRGYLRR